MRRRFISSFRMFSSRDLRSGDKATKDTTSATIFVPVLEWSVIELSRGFALTFTPIVSCAVKVRGQAEEGSCFRTKMRYHLSIPGCLANEIMVLFAAFGRCAMHPGVQAGNVG